MFFKHRNKPKYDWVKFEKDGKMFVKIEFGHVRQDNSIRSAARSKRFNVSITAGKLNGECGFSVVKRPAKNAVNFVKNVRRDICAKSKKRGVPSHRAKKFPSIDTDEK